MRASTFLVKRSWPFRHYRTYVQEAHETVGSFWSPALGVPPGEAVSGTS